MRLKTTLRSSNHHGVLSSSLQNADPVPSFQVIQANAPPQSFFRSPSQLRDSPRASQISSHRFARSTTQHRQHGPPQEGNRRDELPFQYLSNETNLAAAGTKGVTLSGYPTRRLMKRCNLFNARTLSLEINLHTFHRQSSPCRDASTFRLISSGVAGISASTANRQCRRGILLGAFYPGTQPHLIGRLLRERAEGYPTCRRPTRINRKT